MTSVVLAPRREDPDSDVEPVTTGSYRVRISRDAVVAGQWLFSDWSPWKNITSGGVTIKLDASEIPYQIQISTSDPEAPRGKKIRDEFRIVPDSATPVNWWDLTKATGPGTAPPDTTGLEARVAALEAALGNVSGGASQLDEIIGMTAAAQSLNAQTSIGNMRTFLDVPATGALAAKADLASPALTGNPTAPTPAPGDNDTSIATTAFVATAIAGKAGTSAPTINNIVLTGTVTVPDNALAIADVSGLQAALDSSGAASYIPQDWDGVGPYVRPSSDASKRYEVVGPLPAPPIASPANTGTAGLYANDRFTLRG